MCYFALNVCSHLLWCWFCGIDFIVVVCCDVCEPVCEHMAWMGDARLMLMLLWWWWMVIVLLAFYRYCVSSFVDNAIGHSIALFFCSANCTKFFAGSILCIHSFYFTIVFYLSTFLYFSLCFCLVLILVICKFSLRCRSSPIWMNYI